ncbi:DNA polymerase theta [Ixodes scapularis]|uniref:DNA polymerase theta n=1 Tax=Ixodes scapularis TaxID=6945 RepID=UPI001C391D0B|nr:DNA polymerase theta [Ixodes scapularis]
MKARHAAGKHDEPSPSRAERRSGPTTRARAALNKRNGVAVPSRHVAPCNSAGQPEGDGLLLSGWGLPADMVAAYERRGLCRMFPWQRECLLTVLHSGRSLVYSAPTSAGKSLVAEVLMLKRVLETHTKALMVLPFISLAREKLNALQEVACGIRVGGFMGQQRPPGGLASLDVAVCTIEKANGLVNRMLQEGTLAQLGTVVVDEVHLVGDPNRGYLLELMLAKLAYMARRGGSGVQVVAMSACLGNLEALARWLDAELYRCTERPVPLRQLFKVGEELWEGPPLRLVKGPGPPLPEDPEGLLQLCLETWLEGHAVLLFCPTRAWCEALALALARGARLLLARLHSGSLEATHLEAAVGLKEMLEGLQLAELGQQLAATPAGLDPALGRCLRCAVAFHHAGLTTDERDVIEEAFRRGVLRALVATSTLSSGVNLPARRVVIRTPMFHGAPLDVMAYRQMAGRAGRLGMDTHGESVLVCKTSERGLAERLCGAEPPPIGSSLAGTGAATPALKRALLEVVASGVASSPEELSLYWRCTLQHALSAGLPPLDACLSFLVQRQFVHLRGGGEGGPRYHPTQLGLAVLASSLSPDEALSVLADLEQARRCLVLENELHLVYLVTPVHLSSQLGAVDWGRYQALWEGLSPDRQRVAQQAGVTEASLAARGRGREASHRRLLVALALEELLGERPLAQVAPRYGLPKGLLQSLQHGAATFAGMVCAFCEQLGWHGLRLLVSQLQSRLHFGVRPELVELLRLPCLDGPCARLLHDCGFTEPRCLAQATPANLELALSNAGPFRREDEETGKQTRRLWLPGRRPLSHLEAATIVIQEAREFVEQCLGARVAWDGAGLLEASQAHSSRTTVSSAVPEKAQSAATMADAQSEERSSPQRVLCEVGDSEGVLPKSPCTLPMSSPACGDETLQCLEAFNCDSFLSSPLSIHSRTVSNSKEECSLVWDSKEPLDILKWSPAEKCWNSPLVESSSRHANINEDGLKSILKASSIPSTSASTNGDRSEDASTSGNETESHRVGERVSVANISPTDETDSFFVPKGGSVSRYCRGNSLEDGSPGWGQSPILPVFLPEEEEYRLSDSFVLDSQTARALDPPVVEVLARPAKRRSPRSARVTSTAAPVVPEVPGSPQEELFASPCDHEVPCRLRLSPFSDDSSAGSASPSSPVSVRRKRARAERSDEDLFASVCVDEPSGSPGGSPRDFVVCEEGDLSLLGGAWLEKGLFSLALAHDEQTVAVCWHGYRVYLLPLWQQPPGRHSFSQ